MNIIYEIGNYGPIILNLYSCYLLWEKENLLAYYGIGSILNLLLNVILKGLLQQPRPSEDPKQFALALRHGERFIFRNGIPYDIFGMPSGHAQSCFFSTVFVFLSIKKYNSLLVYLLISFVTIYQRVEYNYHTVWQVIIGAIIGVLFAYCMFFMLEQKLKGLIREKPDDDAPI
jgi:membrane-associated phospholipid phosphatase